MVGIYRIHNVINDKNYVGQAIDIKRRWRQHIRKLSNDKHDNTHLQRSWNKYGVECFEFSVLEECEPELLNDREQFWMDEYRAFELGYNQAPVAGSNRGFRHSAETKAKMSAAKKGHVVATETRTKLSAANKGKVLAAESRAKISKPIILIAPDGIETEWPSAAEAARQLELNNSHLTQVILGKRKHHKGFTARFASAQLEPLHTAQLSEELEILGAVVELDSYPQLSL